MQSKKWLAWLALFALMPLAGCAVEDANEDESTADVESDRNGGAADEDVVVDDDFRIDCEGDTQDTADEESGYLACDVDDGNKE